MNRYANARQYFNGLLLNNSALLGIYHWGHARFATYSSQIQARRRAYNPGRLINILENRPLGLVIDVANICNANCGFCSIKHNKRPKRIMSNELFSIIIEQYAELGGGMLSLTPINGDPLVDKDLIAKIQFARQFPQIGQIAFNTNLIALEKHDVSKLLQSGIDTISISTCICDREMYERVYGVDRYDIVMKNIETLLAANAKNMHKVNIVVSLRGEKPYSRVFASDDYKLVARLLGKPPVVLREYRSWNGLVRERDLPSGHKFRASLRDRTEPCNQFYDGLIMYENGDAGICQCVDVNALLTVGNVKKQTLAEIWRGDDLNKMRADWSRKTPGICRECDWYAPVSQLLASYEREILNMDVA